MRLNAIAMLSLSLVTAAMPPVKAVKIMQEAISCHLTFGRNEANDPANWPKTAPAVKVHYASKLKMAQYGLEFVKLCLH